MGDGWGIFFLPAGQALVLDGAAYRETLRRGTLLDLLDADAPAADEGAAVLEEHMRALQGDRESADVWLVAGGENGTELELSAHKCVLACRSAYFRALFSSEFRERGQSRLPLDITPDQLLNLLNFIYTDEWLVEDSDYALDMIPIADRFSVLDLKRLCERTLIFVMSVENVARIFALADRFTCTRLRSRALFFMTDPNHFHLVMKTDSFADLDETLILEILHSHRTTPTPVAPSEPLPGNSLQASKAGQSKIRDHRHGRGSAGTGSAGTARPAQGTSSSAGQGSGDPARGFASGSASTGATGSHAPMPPPSTEGPVARSALSTEASVITGAVDDITMSSRRSSTPDEPPPAELSPVPPSAAAITTTASAVGTGYPLLHNSERSSLRSGSG